VIQEIFGVNGHIRRAVDDSESQGYWTIAAAQFDRFRPATELGYGPEDRKSGMRVAMQIALEATLKGFNCDQRESYQPASATLAR